MKKRFFVCATIMALLLSFTVLAVSVYAAVNQNIFVNNTISFAGKTNNLKFLISGQVTGTTNDSSSDHTMEWDYDYEKMGIVGYEWNLGELQFDAEGKTVEQINITYTFTITNNSSYSMTAEFSGPEINNQGLKKKYLVSKEGYAETEASQIQINRNQTAVLKLVLSLDHLEGFSCNEQVNFSILINALDED